MGRRFLRRREQKLPINGGRQQSCRGGYDKGEKTTTIFCLNKKPCKPLKIRLSGHFLLYSAVKLRFKSNHRDNKGYALKKYGVRSGPAINSR